MTDDDKKCVDCGSPVSKEGYPAFCDYHHHVMIRISEQVVKDLHEGREPQVECDHCHKLRDVETSYYLPNIILCESCYRNDRTLKK